VQSKFVVGVGGGIAIIIGYAVYSMAKAIETVVRTFERGHVPIDEEDTQPLLIPRDAEVEDLIQFIDNSTGKYVVMFGEVVIPPCFCAPFNFLIQNGTGKTTLVKGACVKVCEQSVVTVLTLSSCQQQNTKIAEPFVVENGQLGAIAKVLLVLLPLFFF
jgi:hypothetical protein